jgi:hypothetical protein
MLLKILIGTVLFILVFPFTPPTEKNGPFVGRAESGESADQEFLLEEGLFALENIRGCLRSFRKLTEAAEDKIPKAQWKEIGNTDWEMQELGFSNNPNILEGTLKKQDFLIQQLRWELIKRRVKEGTAGEKDLQEARKAMEASQKAFQEFKENFRRKD